MPRPSAAFLHRDDLLTGDFFSASRPEAGHAGASHGASFASSDPVKTDSEVAVKKLRASALAQFLPVVVVWLGLPVLAAVQTTAPKNPDLVIKSVAGQDLFEFYCASCHGRDGKGNGRVAPALKVAPPDLTTLAQRNRGTFPAARVAGVLEGEERLSTPAHGASDMPVWGPIFKGLDSRDEVNEQRIENLVKYIESIQAKAKAD
jgi:mono/diheme cytochrome c family protein